jgi:Flp pilus assembly protein TadG
MVDGVWRMEGSSLVETALLMPVLVLMLVGTVDLGRGFFALHEVSSAAEAGALYGVQQVTDTNGMATAARMEATELSSMVTAASYGCECSDGSSMSASCTSVPSCACNAVDFVEVDTAYTYTPLFGYPGMPSVFQLNGKARMRAAH